MSDAAEPEAEIRVTTLRAGLVRQRIGSVLGGGKHWQPRLVSVGVTVARLPSSQRSVRREGHLQFSSRSTSVRHSPCQHPGLTALGSAAANCHGGS